MPGGGDMNSFGSFTQGKLTEMKCVSETFLGGHGSPYVAQVSLANAPKFFKALLEGLEYRGTAFYQCFTTCQPEHGVADNLATTQASRIRDSRGLPEFIFNPLKGETYEECMDLKGNPSPSKDWPELKVPGTKEKRMYTVAHWAATEARFRRHLKPNKEGLETMALQDMLACITQADVLRREFLDPEHRSYIPDFGVSMEVSDGKGGYKSMLLSRHMVLFCVERRKAWRLLQSRAGIVNKDYVAQRALLKKVDAGEISVADLRAKGWELQSAEL